SENALISRPQQLVADLRHDRGCRTQRADLALDRGEVETAELAVDGELEHRNLGVHEAADGCVTALQSQIARVKTVRSDGHEGLGVEAVVLCECPKCGLLPRFIAIEGENDLTRT